MTDTHTPDLSATLHTDNSANTTQHGHTTHTDNSSENNPTQTYTIEDDMTDIVNALIDIVRWSASFSLTDFICRLLGRGFDPEGCSLPEWKFDASPETPFVILPNQHVQQEGDGFAVYDGVIYTNAKTVGREAWEIETLTVQEMIAMQQYNPVLRNITLARKIKYHLKQGKNDSEIGRVLGYATPYIKHHRLAFEKAANTPSHSPTE